MADVKPVVLETVLRYSVEATTPTEAWGNRKPSFSIEKKFQGDLSDEDRKREMDSIKNEADLALRTKVKEIKEFLLKNNPNKHA